MNLYILASSLRTGQPVPRYLSGPAAARKRLLDRMEVLEAAYEARKRAVSLEMAKMDSQTSEGGDEEGIGDSGGGVDPARRWEDVYRYAYSSALTDIVEAVQELQRWSRVVVGEEVW